MTYEGGRRGCARGCARGCQKKSVDAHRSSFVVGSSFLFRPFSHWSGTELERLHTRIPSVFHLPFLERERVMTDGGGGLMRRRRFNIPGNTWEGKRRNCGRRRRCGCGTSMCNACVGAKRGKGRCVTGSRVVVQTGTRFTSMCAWGGWQRGRSDLPVQHSCSP